MANPNTRRIQFVYSPDCVKQMLRDTGTQYLVLSKEGYTVYCQDRFAAHVCYLSGSKVYSKDGRDITNEIVMERPNILTGTKTE